MKYAHKNTRVGFHSFFLLKLKFTVVEGNELVGEKKCAHM